MGSPIYALIAHITHSHFHLLFHAQPFSPESSPSKLELYGILDFSTPYSWILLSFKKIKYKSILGYFRGIGSFVPIFEQGLYLSTFQTVKKGKRSVLSDTQYSYPIQLYCKYTKNVDLSAYWNSTIRGHFRVIDLTIALNDDFTFTESSRW